MIRRKFSYINPTDPVSASITNTPLHQLKQETEKLQEEIETTNAGNTLIYRDIPCDSSVRVGMPVYWDSTTQSCKPAYLAAELNERTQEYETGTPADCIGLVYRKHSSYSADILINGIIDFPVLSEYFNGETGRFYLGAIPGSLSMTPNAQAFPLGVVLGTLGPCDTAYRVYFNPCYTNKLFQHQHYSVDLKPEYWSEIMVEDEQAPNDAKYIYNVELDEDLSKLWPPIPISAISATIDWAESNSNWGGKEQTINKLSSLIQVNEYGIYWRGDTDPSSYYAPASGFREFRITIHFSKVQYSTRNAFVTSLQPDTNQPFKFVDCNGQESSAGDLYAQFTLKNNPIYSTDYEGYSLKQFTDNWESEMIPTVHGIAVSGNANVVGTGENSFIHDNILYKTGAVRIDISPYAPDTELAPQIIKVGAAQEREVYGITYLGLPSGRSSSLKLKFEVPANYSLGKIAFYLRMQCIAIIAGSTYANATVKYYKVARASTPKSLENLERGAELITCNFAKSVSSATMFEVESDPITVNAGDTIIVVISREEGDGYSADLAIARIHGILNLKSDEEEEVDAP